MGRGTAGEGATTLATWGHSGDGRPAPQEPLSNDVTSTGTEGF